MTICIAATAENKSAVVVASDRMLSAGFLNLEFDHPGSKIEPLGEACVGLSAGDALPAGDLFLSAHSVSAQLQNPLIKQIADTIKDAYCKLRAKRIEETVFRPRSITMDSFYKQGIIQQYPSELALGLDDRVQRMDFGVTLIVAGADQGGAHIFGISDPGILDSYDRIGYHAIGSGLSHAILSLVASGQHWSKSINETVFNVFRAKRQAELAPGVGQSVELQVITPGKIHQAKADELSMLERTLKALEKPRNKEIDKLVADLPFKGGTEE